MSGQRFRHSAACSLIILLVTLLCGCVCRYPARFSSGEQLKILSYNVNWGGQPDLAADLIKHADADIVCLQETTAQSEPVYRRLLQEEYPFMEFRESRGRMGGGLAFLSKRPMEEVAYVPSDTGWFDGWSMAFATDVGRVQILNVHLRPPVSDKGSWVSGYFSTRDDRVREIERFYERLDPARPIIVAGDFNDGERSKAIEWLKRKGMNNALPKFDRRSPTWQWPTRFGTLKRRMDHVVYSSELNCVSARVIPGGPSDHFPVEAVFTRRK